MAKPVRITFKPEAKLGGKNDTLLSGRQGKSWRSLLKRKLEYGLLKECELEYNILILPVID